MALSFGASENSRSVCDRGDPSVFIASLDTAHALVVSDCLKDLPGDFPMYKRYIAHLDDAFFARLDNEAHNIFTRSMIIAQLREILLSRESPARKLPCSYTIESRAAISGRDMPTSPREIQCSSEGARIARIQELDATINVTFRATALIRHYEIDDQITIECRAFLPSAEISSGIQSLRQCINNVLSTTVACDMNSPIRKFIDRIALMDQITPLH